MGIQLPSFIMKASVVDIPTIGSVSKVVGCIPVTKDKIEV
jgi:1-acyl-sn-glycerol-3-phosphate acyltransferase